MPSLLRVLSCIAALFWAATVLAQPATAPAAPMVRVSVLVFGPGEQIYERYGHCSLRLRVDRSAADGGPIDYACDWGIFSFTSDFLWKFVRKDLRYGMEIYKDGASVINAYAKWGRSVSEYELDLTPEQSRLLFNNVIRMYQGPGRTYDYDYFRNNCATILRDQLDIALDGQLRRQTEAVLPGAKSTRWQTRRLTPVGWTNGVFTALIDVTFGPETDTPLSRWDTMYLPLELGNILETVTVVGPDGASRPLVVKKTVWGTATAPIFIAPNAPPTFWPWCLAAGAGLAGLMLWSTRAPRAFLILAGIVTAIAALWGWFITLVWAFTPHTVVRWNENLLQVSPLSAIIYFGIVVRRWRWLARRTALLVAGLSLCGVLLALLPMIDRQVNLPTLLVAVPINLAVAMGLWRVANNQSGEKPLAREDKEAGLPTVAEMSP